MWVCACKHGNKILQLSPGSNIQMNILIVAFWVTTPYSPVGGYHCCEGTCCLHIQCWTEFYLEDGSWMAFQNVGNHLPDCMVLEQRPLSKYSLPWELHISHTWMLNNALPSNVFYSVTVKG